MSFPTLKDCGFYKDSCIAKGFEVHSLSTLVSQDLYIPKVPHQHSFYQMLYVRRGKGIHCIDFEEIPLQDNMIFFLSPGQVHDITFTNKNPEGIMINFEDHFFNDFLLHQDFIDTLPVFSKSCHINSYHICPDDKTTGNIFDEIENIHQNHPYRNELIRAWMLEIMLAVSFDVRNRISHRDLHCSNQLIKKFRELLEKHFREEHYPKFYADQLAITPNHLNSVCKSMMGKTAGEMIRNRIVLEAKRLLTNSDLSVSQISFEIGFDDNSYFTKFFKASTQITPQQFRKSLFR